jgi:type I restriction enzyme M protein
MALTTLIKSIQDIMRKDPGVDGDAQRISQLVWMIFLKIFDDKEQEREIEEDNYRSPIPEPLRWRNWASDAEGMTGDELLGFVNNELFPTFKSMAFGPDDDTRGFIVKEVFEDSYNYMKSGTLMRQVINKIQEDFDFTRTQDRHIFNDIYEKLLKDLQSAGNAGEFYTPRAVTQFIVDMVNPKLGEKVMDPACGTGGFLVSAMQKMEGYRQITDKSGDTYVERGNIRTEQDEKLWQNSFVGTEKKPLPHLLCITNLLLHGIEVPSKVKRGNALSRPIRDYSKSDRVDVIVTNPPFGGEEEAGIPLNFPTEFRCSETADLFLVLIMALLKDGGRAGMVLPDGFLFGEGVKTRIKEKLLETCNLHTIVQLPKGVFNPYTGINTNLLFFTKGEPTKSVWYYEHPYPEGCKSYNKGKPMRIEEFEPEKAWWNDRQESEQAWEVTLDDIKTRSYNLDIKNPNTVELAKIDPNELLGAYNALLSQVNETRKILKTQFMESLGGE